MEHFDLLTINWRKTRLRLAATSDIHWPQYRKLFTEALHQMPPDIDLFLIAGDLVHRGSSQALKPLVEELVHTNLDCPIYACFGNDDYNSIKDQLREIAENVITFLDDEWKIISSGKMKIALIGSRGVLDQPTFWQARYVQGIHKIYSARVTKLGKLLAEAREKTDYVILLTHYAPTFVTLRGESQRAFQQMGSQRVERLIRRYSPSLVIHGHAHRGKKLGFVGTIPVYNVALPMHKKIVAIEFPPTYGLDQFNTAR